MRFPLLVGLYFAIHGYPVIRLAGALAPGWRPGTPELAAILALPALGWLGHHWRHNAFTRAALRLTLTWTGLCFLLLALALPWEIVHRLLGLDPPASGWLLAAVFAPLAAFSLGNAHWLRTRTVRVASAKVARPLRLVQITDVHVGSRGAGFLRRVVARVNAAGPDAVMITGDLADLRGLGPDSVAALADLQAPGYFAIGNHERYIGADEVCDWVAATGVRVLRDEAQRTNEFRVIGIDDAERKDQVESVLAGLPRDPDAFNLLLYHRPDGLEAAAGAGVDLMLCGHTHNGQILPFNFLVRRVYPRIAGRYRHDGATLYVSPGTGTWGPVMRFGSGNEITVIEVVPENAG